MITGGGYIGLKTFRFIVDNTLGQSSFELPFSLTEDHLVFVDGIITDISYTGIGTTTINLDQSLNQGKEIIIK